MLAPILIHECSHFEDDILGLGLVRQGEQKALQIEAAYLRQTALKNPESLLGRSDPEYGAGKIHLLLQDIDARITAPLGGAYDSQQFNLNNSSGMRDISELRALVEAATSTEDPWDDLNSLMGLRANLFGARHARERLRGNYSAQSEAYRRQWALDFADAGSSESLKAKAQAAALYHDFRFDLENGYWEKLDETTRKVLSLRNAPAHDFADKAWTSMKEDLESITNDAMSPDGLELFWMRQKAPATLNSMKPLFSPQVKAALSRADSGSLSEDIFKPLLAWVNRHTAQTQEKMAGIPPVVFSRLDEALAFAGKRSASEKIKKHLQKARTKAYAPPSREAKLRRGSSKKALAPGAESLAGQRFLRGGKIIFRRACRRRGCAQWKR